MPKKVLMITRGYYPSNASGVHRPVKMAKYLPEFDWEPVVICKDFSPTNSPKTYDSQLAKLPDTCEVIRISDTQSRILAKAEKKLWNLIGGGAHDYRYPYLFYRRMKKKAEQIIQNKKIDAIWATSIPSLDHKIADYLSRKYPIPWVADFRDLPDQSYDNKNIRYAVKQEVRVCSSAKALIAATEQMADKLRARHKLPVHTIFNGFDPDDYKSGNKKVENNNKFLINHFGTLYDFRDPSPLFKAVDTLVRQNKIELDNIEIRFHGANVKRIEELTKNYMCSSKVKCINRLPYPEMVEKQKNSQILLLLASVKQGGAIPAKLYGYLAAGKPILNIPGDGAGTDRILKETHAGLSLSDPTKIALWLEEAYKSWKQSGYVKYTGNFTEIQKYSRKNQAGQLAEILQKIAL